MPARKVIITCAVTGSAHTPTMSPNLPYTVEDVVDQSVAAVEAGAAIIHLHARDPKDGRPTAEPAVFLDYLKGIKDSTDAVVSITSGGGTGMTVDERLRVIYETRPELCTLNLGTFNYGSFPMIPKYAGSWKFDWEEPYLESTRVEPFVSTFADIETMLTDVRKQTGSRFEYEAYDIGHLYTLAYYLDAGLVEPPIFLQTIMGVMGGIGAERRAPRSHAVDGRPPARRCLRVVGAGRRSPPVRDDHGVRGDGLARAGRARGRAVHRTRPARRVERRAGRQDPPDPQRAVHRDRDARRGAPDPRPQGSRPGRLVSGRVRPDAVGTVTVVGTGVIGGGWAAHFLRRGYDVVAWDPGPDARSRLSGLLDTAWPSLERLGLSLGAGRDRLRWADTLEEALADTHFVQESSPEVLDAKVALLAEIDRLADPEVVVASSTSGLLMSDMAVRCDHADRFLVGHPFNPPYLIPLVEVVGGRDTDPDVVTWAEAFYTAAGKTALTMEQEVPGFVGNRLQEALWREALHMVSSGEATVQQIDDSIAHGPGLRWAIMGPMLTFHLAGGPGGMGHMLDHFGPALLEPWTRLEAPPLTPELRDRVVTGAVEEAGGRSVAELERRRDAFLVDLLLLLERHRNGDA